MRPSSPPSSRSMAPEGELFIQSLWGMKHIWRRCNKLSSPARELPIGPLACTSSRPTSRWSARLRVTSNRACRVPGISVRLRISSELYRAYWSACGLSGVLHHFMGGLDEDSYWDLMRRAILGGHDPENFVLTEVDLIWGYPGRSLYSLLLVRRGDSSPAISLVRMGRGNNEGSQSQ